MSFRGLFSGPYMFLPYRLDWPSKHWVWTTLVIQHLILFFPSGRVLQVLWMTWDNEFSKLFLGPLINTFCIKSATPYRIDLPSHHTSIGSGPPLLSGI